jgi:glycosyltransferase involved in cell wall biosynthesis
MRILYSHRVGSRDGRAAHIDALVRAFLAAGHTVSVVGPARFGFGRGRMVGAVGRLAPAAAEFAALADNYRAVLGLRRVCDAFKPDLIYERSNLFFDAGARVAKSARTLYFLEVNAPLAHERMKYETLALAPRASRMEIDAWRAADRVFPVSHVLADIVAAAGVSQSNISVIPNGVDLALFSSRRPGKEHRPVSLGWVGFASAWHGLDGVIEGLAAEPAVQAATLTIIGDGPARSDLERLAAKLKLTDRVTFTGFVPPETVASLLAGIDIALQPRAEPYASPLKIFDYLGAGCAIVAPDQKNIREVLSHGKNAVLFDPEQPRLMWNAVEWLIEEPGFRARLGAAARGSIELENRTWAGNAARIVMLAEQDLAHRRVPLKAS